MKRIFMFITIAAVFTTGVVYAAPADVPKTGQTACYDAVGAVISCSTTTGQGQDGALQRGVAWPGTRFTTNADTTLTDNLTGLVWAPNGNIMPTRDNNWDQDSTVNDGKVFWQHALDYVAKLNTESYLGHNDWRLPNVNELESLLHAEYTRETTCGGACASNAAWLNTQGFTNAQTDNYWSSTTYAGDTSFACIVALLSGNVGNVDKTDGYCVWPVRSGQ